MRRASYSTCPRRVERERGQRAQCRSRRTKRRWAAAPSAAMLATLVDARVVAQPCKHSMRVPVDVIAEDDPSKAPSPSPTPSPPPPPPPPPPTEKEIVRRPSTRKPKPTLESLGPEQLIEGWVPSTEWEPFLAKDLDVLEQMLFHWLEPETGQRLPHDLLSGFVRGYAYRKDCAAASYAYLERCLKWRRANNVDDVILHSRFPLNHDLFERIWPCGPVGTDRDGHLVMVDRPCAVSSKVMIESFSTEALMEHTIARRECVRAAVSASCFATQRRTTKVVSIVDLRGISFGHASSALKERFKQIIQLFGYMYPETTYKTFMIHAPLVFSTIWSVMKHFVHPVTAAKIVVTSGSGEKEFATAGIRFDHGGSRTPDVLPSWRQRLDSLRDEYGAERLAMGFLPEQDERNLAALAAKYASA